MWRLHRVLGVGFAALVIVSSVTGALLVIHHELNQLVERDRHVVPEPASGSPRVPLHVSLQAVSTLAPAGWRPLRIELGEAGESDKFMFIAPDGRTRWSAFVNPHDGCVLWHGADQALLTPWLLQLHMQLRLGTTGYFITAVSGIVLLALGLTGLYIHRDGFRILLRAPVRLRRGWRTAMADLHRWVGIVAIYFPIVLGLTGAIYCFRIIPGQLAPRRPPAAAFDFSKLAPLEPALAKARERFPGAELLRVGLPSSAKAPVLVLLLHREAPVWRKFSRMEFDPATSELRAVRDAELATPGDKFSAMLSPLHFGFYGSSLTKWLYLCGGLSVALLALTGLLMGRSGSARSAEAEGAMQDVASEG